MTALFEDLKDSPLVVPYKGQAPDEKFVPEERSYVRKISIRSSPGRGAVNSSGTPLSEVYYLEGDEARAVKAFVEDNRDKLQETDFSKRNIVKEGVSDEIYEAILQELGERQVRKYRNTVVEERSDGTVWVFDRDQYESDNRTYSIGAAKVARFTPNQSLDELYDSLPISFNTSDMKEIGGFGGVAQVIQQFYVDCGFYDCERVNQVRAQKQSTG